MIIVDGSPRDKLTVNIINIFLISQGAIPYMYFIILVPGTANSLLILKMLYHHIYVIRTDYTFNRHEHQCFNHIKMCKQAHKYYLVITPDIL